MGMNNSPLKIITTIIVNATASKKMRKMERTMATCKVIICRKEMHPLLQIE